MSQPRLEAFLRFSVDLIEPYIVTVSLKDLVTLLFSKIFSYNRSSNNLFSFYWSADFESKSLS